MDVSGYKSSDSNSEITLEGWSERHPVTFDDAKWSDQAFADFMKGQVFPNFLRSTSIRDPLDARLLKTPYGKVGLAFFDSWRNRRLTDRLFEDDDRYELQTWLMHLACSWMSSAAKFKMNRTDIASRSGVESIIELAFQLRAGAEQEWQRDVELVLPDEPEAVTADSIATMPIGQFRREEMEDLFPLSWSYSNQPDSIITFVFVASKDASNRELTRERLEMCFYSAQKHRRALCCKDAPVFGAILHEGSLDFFVSTWEEVRLVVRPIFRRYTLRFFSDFLESYFILCRLEEHTREFLLWEFEHWWSKECNFRERVRETCNRPWRSETRDGVPLESYDINELTSDDVRIDVSKLKHVYDRHSKIILASVLRGPYSPDTGFVLTRKNKKAFDIIMDVDNEDDDDKGFVDVLNWVEDTYKYRHEYEDPAPFCEPLSPRSDGNFEPVLHRQPCSRGDSLTNGANVSRTKSATKPVSEIGPASADNACSVKGNARTKPKRRSKRPRRQLQNNENYMGRRRDCAVIQVC